ncbi:MAG: DUF2520 domain-containing protein [Acidimicrobiia bacterium]|nr:DUF2520 domain-containing protein [Acidimicrobiia bacterium]
MRIVIVGPGRAGLALAIASRGAGHQVVAVLGRDGDHAASGAANVGSTPLAVGEALPGHDLVVIAVRDGDIAEVAAGLAGSPGPITAAVHISGLASVATLAPLAERGTATGSFHPLQTLPTPEAGAARLAGSWVAITAPQPLAGALHQLAVSLGTHPFDLADEAKPLYHAGAAAAANFPLASLTIATDLFETAGVPVEAARPLVEAAVANAFEMGPRAALTGPVVRGDAATVAAQLDAVAASTPEWLDGFAAQVALIAHIAGRGDEFAAVLAAERRAS